MISNALAPLAPKLLTINLFHINRCCIPTAANISKVLILRQLSVSNHKVQKLAKLTVSYRQLLPQKIRYSDFILIRQ